MLSEEPRGKGLVIGVKVEPLRVSWIICLWRVFRWIVFDSVGFRISASEVPPCYSGESWRGVTLAEFTGCRSNLAANRQTRMLADLALVGCYNSTSRSNPQTDAIMLASAKRNLAAMAFFGLTEYQKVNIVVLTIWFKCVFVSNMYAGLYGFFSINFKCNEMITSRWRSDYWWKCQYFFYLYINLKFCIQAIIIGKLIDFFLYLYVDINILSTWWTGLGYNLNFFQKF